MFELNGLRQWCLSPSIFAIMFNLKIVVFICIQKVFYFTITKSIYFDGEYKGELYLAHIEKESHATKMSFSWSQMECSSSVVVPHVHIYSLLKRTKSSEKVWNLCLKNFEYFRLIATYHNFKNLVWQDLEDILIRRYKCI